MLLARRCEWKTRRCEFRQLAIPTTRAFNWGVKKIRSDKLTYRHRIHPVADRCSGSMCVGAVSNHFVFRFDFDHDEVYQPRRIIGTLIARLWLPFLPLKPEKQAKFSFWIF